MPLIQDDQNFDPFLNVLLNMTSGSFFQSYITKYLLYLLHCAEACNKFARPISKLLCLSNTAPFKEMSQQWQAIGNTASICRAWDLNLRPPAPEMNTLLLNQLATKIVSILPVQTLVHLQARI